MIALFLPVFAAIQYQLQLFFIDIQLHDENSQSEQLLVSGVTHCVFHYFLYRAAFPLSDGTLLTTRIASNSRDGRQSRIRQPVGS